MARLDTRLEAEGAEFLVLGELLIRRIWAYKTYTNMPGYDLVAVNPDTGRMAKIQVKSRWQTGAKDFPIKNFDSDFIVFARLNRGSKSGNGEVLQPEYHVFPTDVVEGTERHDKGWSKAYLGSIPDADSYAGAWHLVRDFLGAAEG